VKARIVLLPGDGIGPEVIDAAVRVLTRVAEKFGHQFSFTTKLIGGSALRANLPPLRSAMDRSKRRASPSTRSPVTRAAS